MYQKKTLKNSRQPIQTLQCNIIFYDKNGGKSKVVLLTAKAVLLIAKKSFTCDAAKVWNNAPDKIRTSKTLTTAKKAIREQCKSLPI